MVLDGYTVKPAKQISSVHSPEREELFCLSCGARRMAQAAIRLTDELIPLVPVRQYVVTFPPSLRLWLARSQNLAGKIFLRVWGALCEHLQKESGVHEGLTGGVMFLRRFESGANLNVHRHIIVLDGDFYPG